MLKPIVALWKLLPGRVRLRIIRATQTKFTLSMAAIITNDKREVLLLNHTFRPFSGWGIPGGFAAAGEQPEDAIRREVREETGIELSDLTMFRVRTVGKHVEILFTARSVGEPEVKSPREIIELGWFDSDALPEKLSRSQKLLIREVISGPGR
jgi:8-oxo-dGTP diphosphatase